MWPRTAKMGPKPVNTSELSHACQRRDLSAQITSVLYWGRFLERSDIYECGMDEPVSRAFYDALPKRLTQTGDARIIMAVNDGRDSSPFFNNIRRMAMPICCQRSG